MNGTNYSALQPPDKKDLCETNLYVGRTNDYMEGYNNALLGAKGIADAFKKVVTPAIGKVLPANQTTDFLRVQVKVLSDREPNAADLNSIDSGVQTKKVIVSDLIGKSARLLSLAGLAGLLGLAAVLHSLV